MDSRGTIAEINISALAKNLKTIRERLSPHSFICPMVKANAYGHGVELISNELVRLGVDALGVITLDEALSLREAGVSSPILVFGTPLKPDIHIFREYKLTYVVSEMNVLTYLASKSLSVHLHLKFNTGMNRMGLKPSEAAEAFQMIQSHPSLRLKGVCTHFLNGEDIHSDQGYSRKQIESFRKVYEIFKSRPLLWHMYNSSALFRFLPAISQDSFLKIQGARPGIALYGESPYSEVVTDLVPVMSVKSRIEHLHRIKAGDVVSYGPRWKAEKDSIIAIVPIGYADGYPRALTNNANMLIRGVRVPVVGTVCMDYVMLDITQHPERERMGIGEQVVVIGNNGSESITAHELATRAGTIPYEILTKIGNRVPRVVVEGVR